MITTIFRSRLNPEHLAEYETVNARIEGLIDAQPGFVSIKTFTAKDGERVSLVEFESWEALRAWKAHPEHAVAQRLGRERLYLEYSVTSFEH